MMSLKQLLDGYALVEADVIVRGITLNSTEVAPGDVFIAMNGSKNHGLSFVAQAQQAGAVAVLFDLDDLGMAGHYLEGVSILKVSVQNLKDHLSSIASRFYSQPSVEMAVVGITGTNGKTSCSQFLGQMIPNCGVIGTLGWGRVDILQQTLNTTPDALTVQKMLKALKNEGCQTVAMEVSSHGLAQGRVNAVQFSGAVFTNFSRDHLDYHGSMDAYMQAKLALFERDQLHFAVVNLDDNASCQVLEAIPHNVPVIGTSLINASHLRGETVSAQNVRFSWSGIDGDISWGGDVHPFHVPLIGQFNLENLLSVLGAMIGLGYSLQECVSRLALLKNVRGRMERFGGSEDKPLVIVDYAHTPDALEKILRTLRAQTLGKLGIVFGCGGNRDQGKRSQMGEIAEKLADWTILTDDNPRFEPSGAIIEDILQGFHNKNVEVIHDRASAIAHAIGRATVQDCIVIAGKGHENYQEIQGQKVFFDDAAWVCQIMAQL
jgi:UDP-N-acetylmuramoyl-L-alanyl-D-glutamate--2,6-diaminopimelate ligase